MSAGGRLAGRGALVTGASRGIGLAIAHRLAADGSKVVLTDIDLDAGRRAASDIKGAVFHPLDVTDEAAVAEVMTAADDLAGVAVDVVVCNAGVQTFASVADVTRREWDLVMSVNGWGAFATMRAAGEHLRAAGRTGSVVVIASRTARLGAPTSAHYAASKAAVLNLVKSCAVSYAAAGIRYNAVAPGMIDTALWEMADAFAARTDGLAPGAARAARIAQVPLARPGQPDDVASAVAYLASADSAYVTGECLHVSGGDYLL